MKSKYLLIILAVAITTKVQAGIWGNWIAGGTSCNFSNVSVLDNGDSLSVLFDAFGVNMPEGDIGDGTTARKTCLFRVTLTPPNGFYLAGFKQLYSGGLIKSRGSSAQLNIRYNVGAVAGRALPIIFPTGVSIRPEDPGSVFSKTYYNNLLIANCGASTVYGINMQMLATRRDYSEHLIGGLDSVEAQLKQRIVLIPEWALCP